MSDSRTHERKPNTTQLSEDETHEHDDEFGTASPPHRLIVQKELLKKLLLAAYAARRSTTEAKDRYIEAYHLK